MAQARCSFWSECRQVLAWYADEVFDSMEFRVLANAGSQCSGNVSRHLSYCRLLAKARTSLRSSRLEFRRCEQNLTWHPESTVPYETGRVGLCLNHPTSRLSMLERPPHQSYCDFQSILVLRWPILVRNAECEERIEGVRVHYYCPEPAMIKT